MNKNAVTIKDVAEKAEVSVTTVAHALNGKRPVNVSTKQRIRDIVEELGYTPSYSASHLKKNFSSIIGCFAVDITEDFTSRILRGVEKGLKGSGDSLMIASGVEFGGDYARACRFFRGYGIDGLVVCHHLSVESRLLGEFSRADCPVVFVNLNLPGCSSVTPDNFYAGELAAEHLLSVGMRRPAFLGGPRDRLSVMDRLAGFKSGLEKVGGISLDTSCVEFGGFSYKSGYEMEEALLCTHPEIDGIFCANDYIAAGAMKVVEESGRKIPRDMRIMGCDDREFSSFWNIPITTIELPLEEMGMWAIARIKTQMKADDENDICQTKLKPLLLVRESTAGKAV